ncbi:MAG: right-handed parallel beta-helix repeat-containing protein, partial [Myxococcales bacterium]|nr:right-handed parallel beta-helix repeat-containing protein [Myxococcales bacterium]
GGDGLSWETARNDLRATVEELDFGGVVWVAEGVYEPPDVGEVLRVGPGVQIYGGFAGTETALAQRDLSAHTTTLRQTGPEDVVVIDGFGINSPLIRLDGLEISGAPELSVDARGKGIRSLGNVKSNRDEPQIVLANLDIHDTSGGLIVQNFTTVELHGSSIHHNVKAGGGVAIYQSNSWLRIHDSSIVDNQNTNPGAYGVILHYTPPDNSYFGSLEAWNTTIANNVGAGISGARVHLHGCTVAGNTGSGAHATLSSSYEDCEFRENMGGGVGGSHLDVDRCRFIGNQSDYGGALYAGREVTVRDSVFIGNVATEVGGAIVAWASEFGGGDIDIFDSSFVGNSAKKGGAIYAHAVVVGYKARVDVINGQFIANTAE